VSILSKLTGVHIKIPGVSAIGDAMYNTAKQTIPGLSAVDTGLNAVANLAGKGGAAGAAGAIPGVSALKDFLTGNGGLNALGAAQGVNAALLGKQSSNYAKQAMGSVNQSYGERAPLRTAGIAGMLHPQIPDISPLGQIASANPYARKITPVGGV
jgi:hypothetical protein